MQNVIGGKNNEIETQQILSIIRVLNRYSIHITSPGILTLIRDFFINESNHEVSLCYPLDNVMARVRPDMTTDSKEEIYKNLRSALKDN